MFKVTLCALLVLSGSALRADDRINLAGYWKISFVDDSRFSQSDPTAGDWQSIAIPSSWSSIKMHRGVAWLRGTFELRPEFSRMNRALAFEAFDADETYLNGVLIGRSAAMEDLDSHAYGTPRIYSIPPELFRDGQNVLAFRIRSHLERSGIPQGEIAIGDLHTLEQERALKELRELSFACVYLTAGLYFLLFFLRLPRIRAHFFFAMFCLLLSSYIVLRVPATAEAFGFLQMKRIEYMVLFVLPVPFFAFWAALFGYRQRWYVLVFYLMMASFLYFPLSSNRIEEWSAALGKWYFLMGLGAVCVLFLLFGELRRGSRLARMLLAGTLLFLACIVNDSLADRGVLGSPKVIEYGFLAFVVSMAASLIQSFVGLQLQAEETLQRLTEMDQLKERLVSNATSVLLSPAALILSVARRLRGTERKTNADYEELQQHGHAMNEALDGVLLLSRIQSGVEAAAFRLIEAGELREIYPHFSWPSEARIRGRNRFCVFCFRQGRKEFLKFPGRMRQASQ
jgi:signal transduction histidine kinase